MRAGKAEKMGMRGFVMKPLVLQEMSGIISKVLDGSEHVQGFNH
jgi:hypothetical protein